mmetsp:Transcript_23514/g.32983  ORF Transcript_23514/g.32983 Transcript_23514/m.32983 type:complete len:138 (-) Transcript_23514:296-709(-)
MTDKVQDDEEAQIQEIQQVGSSESTHASKSKKKVSIVDVAVHPVATKTVPKTTYPTDTDPYQQACVPRGTLCILSVIFGSLASIATFIVLWWTMDFGSASAHEIWYFFVSLAVGIVFCFLLPLTYQLCCRRNEYQNK